VGKGKTNLDHNHKPNNLPTISTRSRRYTKNPPGDLEKNGRRGPNQLRFEWAILFSQSPGAIDFNSQRIQFRLFLYHYCYLFIFDSSVYGYRPCDMHMMLLCCLSYVFRSCGFVGFGIPLNTHATSGFSYFMLKIFDVLLLLVYAILHEFCYCLSVSINYYI